jgi:WD40 repeat protein
VVFTPDGRALPIGSRDGTLKVWDTATGKEAVASLAFTPDGRTLVTGQGPVNTAGTVEVWDVATGRERATLKESMYRVLAVAIRSRSRPLVFDGHVQNRTAAVRSPVAPPFCRT